MSKGLENLEVMEYPGRVIVVGRDTKGNNFVGYGLSGRSDSSKARRLKATDDDDFVFIGVTDPKQLEKGDPALLVYNAIAVDGDTVYVSNGAQTDLIRATGAAYRKMHGSDMPLHAILSTAFAEPFYMVTKDGRKIDLTSFEPDGPIFTPRVSGVVRGDVAWLSVVKRDTDGSPVRCNYEVALRNGEGKMIATYDGPNPEKPTPVPAFNGEPRDIAVNTDHPDELVDPIYEALGDFKVSAACLCCKPQPTKYKEIVLRNLHGDGGSE